MSTSELQLFAPNIQSKWSMQILILPLKFKDTGMSRNKLMRTSEYIPSDMQSDQNLY